MNENHKTRKLDKIIAGVGIFISVFFLMLFGYKFYGHVEYNEVQVSLSYNSVINGISKRTIHLEICLEDLVDTINLESLRNGKDDISSDDIPNDDIPNDSEEYSDNTPIELAFPPDLTGLDEEMAVSVCKQNGYTYSIEYYLGGNGTVISQSPTVSENINAGDNIVINIGISQSDFSNRLLGLINQKRSSLGLEPLTFSEQLNYACSILAQENVNSVDCVRPDGSHWSSVIWECGIALNEGTFTTRSPITSLSDANGRIKYAANSYGDGNLLTPSYNIIGMAYSSSNMLVIIIGY